MTTIYFDTSAVNWLYKDPDRVTLTAKISTFSCIYISVFTVAELAATPVEGERIGLLKLAKDISCDYRPLAMPSELLKRSLDALQVRARDMNVSIGPNWNGVWKVLCDPQLIDNEAYSEVINWKNEQEKWYQDMHNYVRPYMQEVIAKLPVNELNAIIARPSKLIRLYIRQPDFITNVVYDIAIRSGNKAVTKDLAKQVIKRLEHWRFFLAGMVYGLYVRSIQRERFSKKSSPGSIDTQQAIYLATCDTFVTSDRRQRSMMRWLVPFGHRKRRIWHYDQFKYWILNIASRE